MDGQVDALLVAPCRYPFSESGKQYSWAKGYQVKISYPEELQGVAVSYYFSSGFVCFGVGEAWNILVGIGEHPASRSTIMHLFFTVAGQSVV